MDARIKRVEYPDLPNYYTCELAAPRVIDGEIQVYVGCGPNYRWGQSRLESHIVFCGDDLVVIEVIGWHKFTVAPVGGRYFFVVNRRGQWVKTNANHRMALQWRLEQSTMVEGRK